MYNVKNIQAKVEDVDVESRIVKGYFSTFGVRDSDNDIIKSGAYSKTIAESGPEGSNRIQHLWQHNPMQPLGKPKALFEDDMGLNFETQVSDTSYGIDALKLYRDEVINEHSVGFEIVKEHYSEEEQANLITEIKLWEGSSVTWGANQYAQGSLSKNLFDQNALIEQYNLVQKAYYNGDYTDETFKLLEKQKEYFEHLLKSALTPQEEPSADTSQQVKAAFNNFNIKLTFEEQTNGITRADRKRAR